MNRTIAYALDFVLDTLDYSPDETPLPADEAELRRQPSADPLEKDLFSVIIWNDEKHSFDEVLRTIQDVTGVSAQEARDMTYNLEANVRVCSMNDLQGIEIRLINALGSRISCHLSQYRSHARNCTYNWPY